VVELIPADGTSQEESGVTALVTANANLRAGPGVRFSIAGHATEGDEVTVIGRNAESRWLYVSTDSGDTAWIMAVRVDLRGSLADVPIALR